MLTQRTVAKFQRLLSGLMQHGFFGMSGTYSVLPPANYYNLLYEADVPRQLLDVLMKRTYFDAVPATLALYEGHAVAEAREHSYVTDNDRQMGIAYLLCLMAVAFRAYERLEWERRSIFEDYAREFKESLEQDGFVYHSGTMYETATGDRIVPVPLDGNPPRAVVPAKPQPPALEPSAAITAPAEDLVEEHPAKTRKQRLVDAAVVVGVLSIVVTVVVTLFSKEIHDWLLHAWARLLH
jgi:hypothetical protein